MGVEPASPCPPELTAAQRKEFFKGVEIANRFKAILDKLMAYSRQSQDRYEENANRHRTDAPQYHVDDLVMLHTGNLKTGRPTQKLTPRWEGPFKVLKASSHAVTLALPQNMKVNNTFHVQLVRRWEPEGMPGQELAGQEVRANKGRIMTRTDDFQEAEKWLFEDILDYGKGENGRWQYLIKWKDYDEPTWQPATDLKGCDEWIWQYHKAHPRKPPPPQWVSRRRTEMHETEEQLAPGAQRALERDESDTPGPEEGSVLRNERRGTRARTAANGLRNEGPPANGPRNEGPQAPAATAGGVPREPTRRSERTTKAVRFTAGS
jgi:hypothetical protein